MRNLSWSWVVVMVLGCGARTPLRGEEVRDASSTDLSDEGEVSTALDAGDEGEVSACEEGSPCTRGVGVCEIGRVQCVDGMPVCRPVGNQPPGTACEGGACDGNGRCRPSDQRSCPMPSESGCGVVFLVGGSFTLGSPRAVRASPVQRAIGVGGFVLDAYEVTVARFRRYWEAGHPTPMSLAYSEGAVRWEGPLSEPLSHGADASCNWRAPDRDYHPMNCVDWPTAQAFCAWDGHGVGRLPTEAEWEFAARQHPGTGLSADRLFPWGDAAPDPRCDRAQWMRCPGDDGGATRRVGSFANTAGFFDLAGNVWEWTGDLFAPYGDPRCWGGIARENPRCGVNATGYPTIRGGSWFSVDAPMLSGASRDDAFRPSTRSPIVGFRCARTRTR